MWKFVLCVMGCACLTPSVVLADSLDSTLNQPLKEITHDVVATLEQGVVTFTVTRTFANLGKIHDEAYLNINLPAGATATGLRIRSGTTWYDGQLMEAEKAQNLYDKLTGLGPHRPKDPALLRWAWANELILQVFPVPPGRTAVVEYTLKVPTDYVSGQHVFFYPHHNGDTALAAPTFKLSTSNSKDRLFAGAVPIAHGMRTVLSRREVASACSGWNSSASCVTHSSKISSLNFDPKKIFVDVDIRHTYRGDLSVQLVDPDGKAHVLHHRKGGGKNNLKRTFTLERQKLKTLKGTWTLRIRDLAGYDTGSLRRWSIAFKRDKLEARTSPMAAFPVFIPDAPRTGGQTGMQRFTVTSFTSPKMMSARYGAVTHIKKHQFGNLHLDIAKPLSTVPEDIYVVFVVDVSHSQGLMGVQAQLETIEAYLRHTPKAKVEVVLTHHLATRLFGAWVDATSFRSRIKKAWKNNKLNTHNGSHIDRGMMAGFKTLTSAPQGSTPRMVVFTDNALRYAYNNQLVLPEFKRKNNSKSITHIISNPNFNQHAFELKRNDDHDLFELVKVHGGLTVDMGGLPTQGDKDKLRSLNEHVLHLVRPIMLEHTFFVGDVFETNTLPEVLVEGQGVRIFEQIKSAPRRLMFKGQLWSRPVQRIIRSSNTFAKLSAGWVFSHDLHDPLNKKEQYRLAMHAGVVSPQTSFLAIEPGVRPSRAGIDRGGGSGSGGIRGIGKIRTASGAGRAVKYDDMTPLFQAIAQQCASTHKVSTWSLNMDIETSSKEILDVILPSKPSGVFEQCVVKGAWSVNLMKRHISFRHQTLKISVKSS